MRKLLIAVVALIALLLAAEVGVTLLGQRGMERALRARYQLPPDLEVSVNSFPFLLSLARNHLGELQLVWKGELSFRESQGAAGSLPYACRANLYDVELDMTSLLRGKLEIREISRLEARLSLDVYDLSRVLSPAGALFIVTDGGLYLLSGGAKVEYKVEVCGDRSLTFLPSSTSSETAASSQNPDVGVYTLELDRMPLDATLNNARLEAGRVVVAIFIPGWEGYL